MAATFPGGVKSFSTKQADDNILPNHVNDLQDEVIAIETELRKTATGTSVVDHGALSGLSDDDHPQYVNRTTNQTIAGVKTFSAFPATPSSAPTTNYQVANKKYVDDQKGRYIPLGAPGKVVNGVAVNIGTYTVNLSTYSIPVSATGVVIRLGGRWASAGSGNTLTVRSSSGADVALVIRANTNTMHDTNGIVPTASGSFVYGVAGANAEEALLYITGYFT